ncbi:MAG TPA: hypothetical protein VMZ52_04930 [Bryobacteraceae bacterium]|nr:hypothetical protein [Bryobacteraceae bacterium]
MRATWDLSTTAPHHRIRYGTTTTYESSKYGGIQPVPIGTTASDAQGIISGLHPGTAYHFCPQSSDDGASWSPCVDAAETTLEAPETHPELPTLPAAVDIRLPDTAEYAVFQVAKDCSNLGSTLVNAENARTLTGAIVVWPENCDTEGLSFPSPADQTSPLSKWVLVVPEWPLGSNFTVASGTRVQSGARGLAKLTLAAVGFHKTALSIQNLHHWRFIGLEVTTAVTTEDPATTTDPTPYGQLAGLYNVDHVIFDRCYFHGQGYPSRIARGVYFSGKEIAFIDSAFENIDHWKSGVRAGLRTSAASPNVLTIAAGTYYLGHQVCTFRSEAKATIRSGSADGKALVYVDMHCNLKVVAPLGLSADCSGCLFSTETTPAYPVNENHNRAFGALASVQVSSGSWAAVTSFEENSPRSAYQWEGPTGLLGLCAAGNGLGGAGGGPVLIQNNGFEVENIAVHLDDSCTNRADYNNPGADFSILRNLFTLRSSWYPLDPAYDHKVRAHRNHLEFKMGKRILIDGNIFENSWASVTAYGFAIVVTPTKSAFHYPGTDGTGITDITVTNNTIRNSGSGMLIIGGVEDGGAHGVPPALQRLRIDNNLVQTAGRYDPSYTTAIYHFGPGLMTRGGMEDIRLSHNTFVNDSVGNTGATWWYHIYSLIEGMEIKDNIFIVADYSNWLGSVFESTGFPQPACGGMKAKAMMDCALVSGAGNTSYTFAGNVLVPWTSANVNNWVRAYRGSTVVTGANSGARLAAVGCLENGDGVCALPAGSNLISMATDGLNPGVDVAKLEIAQGIPLTSAIQPVEGIPIPAPSSKN